MEGPSGNLERNSCLALTFLYGDEDGGLRTTSMTLVGSELGFWVDMGGQFWWSEMQSESQLRARLKASSEEEY